MAPAAMQMAMPIGVFPIAVPSAAPTTRPIRIPHKSLLAIGLSFRKGQSPHAAMVPQWGRAQPGEAAPCVAGSVLELAAARRRMGGNALGRGKLLGLERHDRVDHLLAVAGL